MGDFGVGGREFPAVDEFECCRDIAEVVTGVSVDTLTVEDVIVVALSKVLRIGFDGILELAKSGGRVWETAGEV